MNALSPVIRLYHESVEETKEDNFGPSMVEECYNPSIQDLFTNPSLALRHQRQGSFDSDKTDEISETDSSWDSDIQNIKNSFFEDAKRVSPKPKKPNAPEEGTDGMSEDKRSVAKRNESVVEQMKSAHDEGAPNKTGAERP